MGDGSSMILRGSGRAPTDGDEGGSHPRPAINGCIATGVYFRGLATGVDSSSRAFGICIPGMPVGVDSSVTTSR